MVRHEGSLRGPEFHKAKEAQSPGGTNTLVMGPGYHGGWNSSMGDTLGGVDWGSATSLIYTDSIERPFFDHWLKDALDPGAAGGLHFRYRCEGVEAVRRLASHRTSGRHPLP